MKTETFDGKMESAYGRALPSAIPFEGSFEAYETYEEITAANDLPSHDDILSFVNTKRKSNARQKAMTAALDAAGINKPTLDDPQVQLRTMIKVLVASGRNEAEATTLAENTLGVKLA
jgi:hypothetical protein